MSRLLSFIVSRPFKTTAAGIEIPFEVERNGIIVSDFAKVDPGSKYCLFRREVGENLGLEVLDGEPIELSTLTDTFTAYGHWITLRTLDLEFDSFVLFHQAYDVKRNLLGRIGWLDNTHFALTMDDEMIHLNSFR